MVRRAAHGPGGRPLAVRPPHLVRLLDAVRHGRGQDHAGGRRLLLDLPQVPPLGVRGGRVHVRRLRARPVALPAQAELLRSGTAAHAVGLAVRHSPDRHRDFRGAAHLLGDGSVLPEQRHAHREGCGPGAQLPPTHRHHAVLLHDVCDAGPAYPGGVRDAAVRDRLFVRRHLQLSAHQDQPHLSDLRERAEVGEEAQLHLAQVPAGHCFGAHLRPGDRDGRLVPAGAARHQAVLSGRKEESGQHYTAVVLKQNVLNPFFTF